MDILSGTIYINTQYMMKAYDAMIYCIYCYDSQIRIDMFKKVIAGFKCIVYILQHLHVKF